MNRKGLLKHLVFLMFFIFIVELVGDRLYWYSLFWYFDVILHFLGGLWVGIFFLYVFLYQDLPFSGRSLLLAIFFSTLFIGIFWEVYEYVLHVISKTDFNTTDAVTDVVVDLAGAVTSFTYYFNLNRLK